MDKGLDYIKKEIERVKKEIEDNKMLLEESPDMKDIVKEEIVGLEKQKESLEEALKSMDDSSSYSEGHSQSGQKDGKEKTVDIDQNTAILEIRSGTGGDEAGLFAKDLYRMYIRYGDKNNWKVEENYLAENEAGGVKTIISEIRGQNVYELLKNESGVHRVQRVPTTESAGRTHTSTATVAVLPKIKHVEIDIRPEELSWEFYRSGGKGGQNVNKVSTAVRLTHIPTGVIVECQEERFQGKNREKALSILHSKLYTQMQEQNVKSISDLRTSQVGSAERSEKIRTYNFPQDRITDHRINKSWHSIERVMNGEIEKILLDTKNI